MRGCPAHASSALWLVPLAFARLGANNRSKSGLPTDDSSLDSSGKNAEVKSCGVARLSAVSASGGCVCCSVRAVYDVWRTCSHHLSLLSSILCRRPAPPGSTWFTPAPRPPGRLQSCHVHAAYCKAVQPTKRMNGAK